ncbi:hypothetical protein M0R45_001054 [Rubus argutus]|uniref:Uncharacterized protein n=1 Tax=Rubus argutus TaxID=59490 RepID=A0AAW1VK74_RUBAR
MCLIVGNVAASLFFSPLASPLWHQWIRRHPASRARSLSIAAQPSFYSAQFFSPAVEPKPNLQIRRSPMPCCRCNHTSQPISSRRRELHRRPQHDVDVDPNCPAPPSLCFFHHEPPLMKPPVSLFVEKGES